VFDYFVRNTHWLTTAALLLGMSVGNAGTMVCDKFTIVLSVCVYVLYFVIDWSSSKDTAMTKLLSIHLPALQPPLSAGLIVNNNDNNYNYNYNNNNKNNNNIINNNIIIIIIIINNTSTSPGIRLELQNVAHWLLLGRRGRW
jgi:hypothetical protein